MLLEKIIISDYKEIEEGEFNFVGERGLFQLPKSGVFFVEDEDICEAVKEIFNFLLGPIAKGEEHFAIFNEEPSHITLEMRSKGDICIYEIIVSNKGFQYQQYSKGSYPIYSNKKTTFSQYTPPELKQLIEETAIISVEDDDVMTKVIEEQAAVMAENGFLKQVAKMLVDMEYITDEFWFNQNKEFHLTCKADGLDYELSKAPPSIKKFLYIAFSVFNNSIVEAINYVFLLPFTNLSLAAKYNIMVLGETISNEFSVQFSYFEEVNTVEDYKQHIVNDVDLAISEVAHQII